MGINSLLLSSRVHCYTYFARPYNTITCASQDGRKAANTLWLASGDATAASAPPSHLGFPPEWVTTLHVHPLPITRVASSPPVICSFKSAGLRYCQGAG